MSFEAGSTTASVTDAFYDLTFNTRFSVPPAFLSSMASYNGSDNGLIRYENLTLSGVRVGVREDTTADTETLHAIGEIVSYLAIDGSGTLLASVPQLDIGETGKITDLNEVSQTIMLKRRYANPVVLAQSASYNGSAPVSVRVNNVQSDQFDIYLQEPSNENNTHGVETVTYLVLEAGVHSLPSGKQWETANFDDDTDVDITNFKEILRNYSPHGYATQAVRVVGSVVPLLETITDGQKIETWEPLVALNSVVKYGEDRVVTERIICGLG